MVSRGSLLFFKSVGQGSRSSRGAFRVQRTLVPIKACLCQKRTGPVQVANLM